MPFVPDRIASNIATPNFSIDTPKAAFGGAWADAMQSAGAEIKGAGNELFARAQAMQELQNRTEATDATTQFMIESGKLHADYQTKLGKDAVEGLPGYQQSLQDLRDKIGNSVNSPMARKMYDSETKSTMGRTLFNAAGHAASEQKRWVAGSAKASIEASKDRALVSPEDDVSFQAELKDTEKKVNDLASIQGMGTEERDQTLAVAKSQLWERRIKGLADRKPETAYRMLSEATSRGDIRGDTLAATTTYVNQKLYTVGARHIEQEVKSGTALGTDKVGILQARGAISSIESGSWGGNYSLLGPEVFRKDGTFRGKALGRYQVMPENLPEWLAQAGLPSMTPAEFLKNPKAQDAVFDKVFGDYMEKYGNFNDAASKWFSGRTASEAIAAGANDKYTSIQGYLAKTNAALGRNNSLASREQLGLARAKEIAPDDPLFHQAVVDRIRTGYNGDQATKRADLIDQRQILDGSIVGLQGQGNLPTTVEELTATPEAKEAWDRMNVENPAEARKYYRYLEQNSNKEERERRTNTPERTARWQQLRGMAMSADGVKKFLETNILDEDLTPSQQTELVRLQQAKAKNADDDPRVNYAMSQLGTLLQPLGIATRTKDNEAAYYQFKGALQDALQQFQETEKRAPKPKEITEIGSKLIQEVATGRPGWISNLTGGFITRFDKGPLYQDQVPEDAKPIIRKIFTDKGLPEPTDAQMQREWVNARYQELWGKAKATQ